MIRFEYFPSTVYRDERPDWVAFSEQAAQKYFADAPSDGPMVQTMDMSGDGNFGFFTEYLLAASESILREQGYAVDRSFLKVSGLWGQDIRAAGGTNVHVHKNSQLCGWFFMQAPEQCAYPIYHDPRFLKQMVELDPQPSAVLTASSAQVHFDNVVPGTVLLSNSWLQHQLVPRGGTGSTRVLHFIVSHRGV